MGEQAMPTVGNGLFWILAIAFGTLTVGSGIRAVALRRAPRDVAEQRLSSLAVWWLLAIAFAAALLLGKVGLSLLFCLASLLALREFHRLFQLRSMDNPLLGWTIGLLAIVHYALLAFTNSPWSLWALSIIVLVTVSSLQIATGRTKDYLRTTAGYYWASVLLIFGLSHAVLLVQLPSSLSTWSAGSVGWCIFVVALTELNDIAQALVGRRLGHHKITPAFSPGKSWEGLAAGFLVATVLSVLLAPWLTTLTVDRPVWHGVFLSFVGGAIISVSGLLGDLNMSGLKREAGVKDSGSLLPGMGGIIDRIDSLTFTAPTFYYYAVSVL